MWPSWLCSASQPFAGSGMVVVCWLDLGVSCIQVGMEGLIRSNGFGQAACTSRSTYGLKSRRKPRPWSGRRWTCLAWAEAVGEGQKGTPGRGREKQNHDNFRQFFDTSQQFPTFLRHVCLFVHVTEFVIKRHKSAIKCHDNIRHFCDNLRQNFGRPLFGVPF